MWSVANTIANYTDGIGLYREEQSNEKEVTVWTGVSTPADLTFWLEEALPVGTVISFR